MERTLLAKFTNLFRRILISFLWALTLVHFPPILKRRKILILKSCLTTVKSGSCKVTNARWPTTVTVKSFLPWENKFTHGKIIRHSKIMSDKGKSFSNVKEEPPSVKRSPEDCGLKRVLRLPCTFNCFTSGRHSHVGISIQIPITSDLDRDTYSLIVAISHAWSQLTVRYIWLKREW